MKTIVVAVALMFGMVGVSKAASVSMMASLLWDDIKTQSMLGLDEFRAASFWDLNETTMADGSKKHLKRVGAVAPIFKYRGLSAIGGFASPIDDIEEVSPLGGGDLSLTPIVQSALGFVFDNTPIIKDRFPMVHSIIARSIEIPVRCYLAGIFFVTALGEQ